MGVVTYLDNNQLHKPDTGGAPVFAVINTDPLSVEQLKANHPDVFGLGVGRLEGSTVLYWTETYLQCKTLLAGYLFLCVKLSKTPWMTWCSKTS